LRVPKYVFLWSGKEFEQVRRSYYCLHVTRYLPRWEMTGIFKHSQFSPMLQGFANLLVYRKQP
jgi:hypothetical protein